MADPCACTCTSQNGSGWCFPFELNFVPSFELDEELDIGPSPRDVVDVKVIRSSGSAGVCDTILGSHCIEAYYCQDGEKVTAPEAIPQRTANIGLIIPNDTCVDYSNINMPTGGTTADGYPFVQITGVPMEYSAQNDQLCARWSFSLCGIEITGCCDPAVQGFKPGYETCYTVIFTVNTDENSPLCENELTVGTDGSATPRIIKTVNCDGYSYNDCDKVPSLNPFEPSGVDTNTWRISNKCFDIQSGLPDQSGIYNNGSYVGGFGPTPSGIQPIPPSP